MNINCSFWFFIFSCERHLLKSTGPSAGLAVPSTKDRHSFNSLLFFSHPMIVHSLQTFFTLKMDLTVAFNAKPASLIRILLDYFLIFFQLSSTGHFEQSIQTRILYEKWWHHHFWRFIWVCCVKQLKTLCFAPPCILCNKSTTSHKATKCQRRSLCAAT